MVFPFRTALRCRCRIRQSCVRSPGWPISGPCRTHSLSCCGPCARGADGLVVLFEYAGALVGHDRVALNCSAWACVVPVRAVGELAAAVAAAADARAADRAGLGRPPDAAVRARRAEAVHTAAAAATPGDGRLPSGWAACGWTWRTWGCSRGGCRRPGSGG